MPYNTPDTEDRPELLRLAVQLGTACETVDGLRTPQSYIGNQLEDLLDLVVEAWLNAAGVDDRAAATQRIMDRHAAGVDLADAMITVAWASMIEVTTARRTRQQPADGAVTTTVSRTLGAGKATVAVSRFDPVDGISRRVTIEFVLTRSIRSLRGRLTPFSQQHLDTSSGSLAGMRLTLADSTSTDARFVELVVGDHHHAAQAAATNEAARLLGLQLLAGDILDD